MKNDIFREYSHFKKFISTQKDLSQIVIQNINFVPHSIDWDSFKYKNTIFLGCTFTKENVIQIISKGGFIYPKFENLPYNAYRDKLYHWKELMDENEEDLSLTKDFEIYTHFSKTKFNPPMHEALAQRIHDNSIDKALKDSIGYEEGGKTKRKAVGFMGGHSEERGSVNYIRTAKTAKLVAEAGYYIVSGGGPGIMEAANLGAYFAHKMDDELMNAITILARAPHYTHQNYIKMAKEVLKIYPKGEENLAIPTWFYGHEPSNLFASSIAKYFSNSIREDILLAISIYGVVFAPGSAGTTQEIFQEAAQNHYGTFGFYSPMIFLGKERYIEESSIYSVLHQLAKEKEYKKLLHITDEPKSVLQHLQNNPPIQVK